MWIRWKCLQVWQGFDLNCMPSLWKTGGCSQLGVPPSLPSTICPQTIHLPTMQRNLHSCVQFKAPCLASRWSSAILLHNLQQGFLSEGGMADPHEVAHERPTALSCLQQTLPHTLSSQSAP